MSLTVLSLVTDAADVVQLHMALLHHGIIYGDGAPLPVRLVVECGLSTCAVSAHIATVSAPLRKLFAAQMRLVVQFLQGLHHAWAVVVHPQVQVVVVRVVFRVVGSVIVHPLYRGYLVFYRQPF